MELRDYLRILRRRWRLITVVALLVVSAAAAVTFSTTPLYASKARLFISTSSATGTSEAYQGGLFSVQQVASYAELASSRRLAETVIDDLGVAMTPKELVRRSRPRACRTRCCSTSP